MSLNLFPARVPIGYYEFKDKDGRNQQQLILASPEFLRAMTDLFARVGGVDGTGNADLINLLYQALTDAPAAQPTQAIDEPAMDYSAAMTSLSRQIEEIRLAQSTPAPDAGIAALRAQVEQLALQIPQPAPAPNYGDFLQAYAAPQAAVDWEHPGRIGAMTASTIRGTTVTATGAFGCNAKAAQTAAVSGGALAAYAAGANGLDSGANMSALHAMVVTIRAALVANGIMS